MQGQIAPTTIAELQTVVEHRFRFIGEVSGPADGREFVPNEGWHTIRVLAGPNLDSHALRAWWRLFNNYAINHIGGSLYWRHVVHFDHEKGELSGTFCIQ